MNMNVNVIMNTHTYICVYTNVNMNTNMNMNMNEDVNTLRFWDENGTCNKQKSEYFLYRIPIVDH